VQALQVTLGQWAADLEAMAEQPKLPSLDFDGRVMRILRRSSAGDGAGLYVVAWATRSINGAGYWMRWQSPELRTRGELDLAWKKAQVWAQTPSDDDRNREVRTVPLDDWQIYYYRENAWTHPQSSEGTPGLGGTSGTPAPSAAATPDGVRLVLNLSAGQAISGTLTRDWVRPVVGASK
jgi:general secretion pathway protein J